MVVHLLQRVRYRVRQFGAAVLASMTPITEGERATAHAWLALAARPLFDGMPRNDQRHSLKVLAALIAAGHDDPALMQAALLHDVAKNAGGVTLWHRITAVVLKAVWPGWLAGLTDQPAPARRSLGYPFWTHANHPWLGAELAAAAGCNPLTVALIRRHQEPGRGAGGWASAQQHAAVLALEPAEHALETTRIDQLLAALRAADDDN